MNRASAVPGDSFPRKARLVKTFRIPTALAVITGILLSYSSPLAGEAQSGPIHIAVITDMSGVYAALAGRGAVEATKMAVEDFGGSVLGRQIVVDTIDHRNNGPEAAAKAREAYDAKTWYGIVPNYAFGQQMLADFTAAIKPEGASFVHTDMIPLATPDFSSYVIAAKASGAQVLGVLNAGADTVNTMKAVKQFGLDKTMKIAVGLLFLSDVDALPDVFAGSRITTSWYWNEDKPARAWADRFTKRIGGGLRPTSIQAADYSATTQWLNAVKAAGSVDADKVVAYLDGRQFNDFYAHAAEWRARDHRVTHEMYVVDVLSKEQIKEPHAWYKIVQVIPPSRAFRPESQSVCKKDW